MAVALLAAVWRTQWLMMMVLDCTHRVWASPLEADSKAPIVEAMALALVDERSSKVAVAIVVARARAAAEAAGKPELLKAFQSDRAAAAAAAAPAAPAVTAWILAAGAAAMAAWDAAMAAAA